MIDDYELYNPDEHDVRIKAVAYEMGQQHIDDDAPATDDLINDIERFIHVALPDRDGPALTKIRRMVRQKFNEGWNDDL